MLWQESAHWKTKLGTVLGQEQTEDFCLLFLAEQLVQGRGMSLGSRHHLHPSTAGPQERMAQHGWALRSSQWKEEPCHEVSIPQAPVSNAPKPLLSWPWEHSHSSPHPTAPLPQPIWAVLVALVQSGDVEMQQLVMWPPALARALRVGLCLFLSPAVFDREQHTLNLPAVNSITYVLRFLEKLCHNLRSDNLFGNQPFSQHSHAPRSHEYDHDRYLPGRSWGGGGTGGTPGPVPSFPHRSGGGSAFCSDAVLLPAAQGATACSSGCRAGLGVRG